MATSHDSMKSEKEETMSTAEAGERGGRETAKRGPEFYSEIGSQQGKSNNPGNFANRNPDDVRAAARKGGANSHRGDAEKAA